MGRDFAFEELAHRAAERLMIFGIGCARNHIERHGDSLRLGAVLGMTKADVYVRVKWLALAPARNQDGLFL